MGGEPDAPTPSTSTSAALDALGAVAAVQKDAARPSARRAADGPAPLTRRPPSLAHTVLGVLIPALLLAFIAFGARLVLLDAVPLLRRDRPVYGLVVGSAFVASLVPLFALYVWIISRPRDHARPSARPPPAIADRAIAFECDEDGRPATCQWCPAIDGAQPWLPPRARHCRECGVCVLGFDHHCAARRFDATDRTGAWLGRCVSARTLKPFMIFLALVPIAVGAGLLAVAPSAFRNLRLVVSEVWHDPVISERWWARRRSWAVGPVWRCVGGDAGPADRQVRWRRHPLVPTLS